MAYFLHFFLTIPGILGKLVQSFFISHWKARSDFLASGAVCLCTNAMWLKAVCLCGRNLCVCVVVYLGLGEPVVGPPIQHHWAGHVGEAWEMQIMIQLFSCPEQLNSWPCQSATQWFTFWFQCIQSTAELSIDTWQLTIEVIRALQSCCRDMWPF